MFLFSCSKEKGQEIIESSEVVEEDIFVLTAESVEAGKEFYIEVSKDIKHVAAIASWGSFFLKAEKIGDKKLVKVPHEVNRQAGRLTIKFFNEEPDREIKVIPGKAAEPLEAYVGEKSIVADGGETWAMMTTIPQDEFFNLTVQGTKVDLNMIRPNGSRQNLVMKTKYGVAFHKILSQSKVGKTIISVNTGGVAGKEKELLEIAGPPVDFMLKAENIYPYADSRQYFQIVSSQIKDRYSNQVANGTLVEFHVTDADGSKRILNAYTISGEAKLNINNPSHEGLMTVQASIGDYAKSNTASYSFGRHIKSMELRIKDKRLIIGPVMGRFGQYATDGTEVIIENVELGFTTTVAVKKGYARFSLESMETDNYTFKVTCGGLVKTIKNKVGE